MIDQMLYGSSDSDDELLGLSKFEDNPRRFKKKGSTKYQKLKEIKYVKGFIVNVHDATNYDIDLQIPPDLRDKYNFVVNNKYTYQDLDENFYKKPDLKMISMDPKIGKTYRCRLRGIGINNRSTPEDMWKIKQMFVNVKQLIDRTDGWAVCTLSDVDVYQRLLVDIVIYTSEGAIDICDYLLSMTTHENNPIFYRYSGKNSSILSKT